MKRLRTIMILAAAILAVLLGRVLMLPPEPSYHGRTVEEWLETELKLTIKRRLSFVRHHTMLSLEAQQAIKAIGTNAVPTLLEMIHAEDSWAKVRVNSLLDRQQFIGFRYRFTTAWERQSMALWGFQTLAEEARFAAPTLALAATNGPQDMVRYPHPLTSTC